MKMEALARTCIERKEEYYPVSMQSNRINWDAFLAALLSDVQQQKDTAEIAWKVFFSLYKMIAIVTEHFDAKHIAFSGGVFQNSLLVHLLTEHLPKHLQLYFHRQLSPNDECIGFGQIACYKMEQAKSKKYEARNKASQLQFTN
jgi:hydrogenase maturation protein HypF